MATKRNLYHPAPKSNVGQKKLRKPLIQGRLVTDSAHGASNVGVGHHHLIQGQLLEETMDPTISPMKFIPKLTENMSPHAEPRSRILDLSDAEVDGSESSDSDNPQPVLVFDASHLGTSPHTAEVEVVVGYENSPAKVFCHTPSKLERSLRAELNRSPRSPQASKDDKRHTIRVNQVTKLCADPESGKGSMQSPRLHNEKENINRKRKESGQGDLKESISGISLPSRGIIEEILAHELGHGRVDAISLSSEVGSPENISAVNSSISKPHHVQSLSEISLSKSLSPTRKSKTKNVNFKDKLPQPKFDDDSDTSADKIPVQDKTPRQPSGIQQDNLKFESCSMEDEHVSKGTPKTLKSKESGKEFSSDGKTKRRVKSTRIVPSRYMHTTLNKTGNVTLMSSGSSSSNLSQTMLKPAVTSVKGKLIGSRPDPRMSKSDKGKNISSKNAKSSHSSTVPSSLTSLQPQICSLKSDFPRSESPSTQMQMLEEHLTRKTSTPTHDKSVFPHDIDASAIQSVSTMSINMSTIGGDGSHSDNRAELDSGKKPAPKSSSSKGTVVSAPSTPLTKSLELDMAYTKYLQWVFLNGKAKQFYEDEEALATAQIHGLWKLLESKREEGAALDLDVDILKKYNRLDEVLEKTESELESLTAVLPQLEEDYSHLSAALDTTRHQIPVEDIFLPQDGVERDIYEEKLENALKESEQLLEEISTITGVKLEPLQHYLNYMEAIDANLTSTRDEIGACEGDLDVVQGLTTRLTSLIVQDMQSK